MQRYAVRLVLAVSAASLVLTGCPASPGRPALVLSVTGTRTVEKGATRKVTIVARTTFEDGQVPVPLAGTVTLEASDAAIGTVEPASVVLDADGKGEATVTMCKTGEACLDGDALQITGTLPNGATPLTSTLRLTLEGEKACPETPDCAVAACAGKICPDGECSDLVCKAIGASDGELELTVDLYDPDGQPRTVARAPVGSEPFKLRVKVITTADGKPAKDEEIVVSVTGGIGGVAATADGPFAASFTGTTTADGFVLAYFEPSEVPGSGKIVIRHTESELQLERPFDVVRAGTLAFLPSAADAYYRVLGVQGSGWQEQSVLRFKLFDSAGQAYVEPVPVTFSIATLATGATGTAPTMAPSVATTDANGEVVTTIASGTGTSTVAVTATATIGDQTVTTTSDTLAIVGAVANGREFGVTCGKRSVAALWANDCHKMRAETPVECEAKIGDWNQVTFGRSTRINWLTEAGYFGPSSSTPLYDPDAEPSDQLSLGMSFNVLSTRNGSLPFDVPPLAGEARQAATAIAYPCPTVGDVTRTLNPRDGLNTIVAYTQGEEGYDDLNANGRWDTGEPFYDQGEPYLDVNDNNVRDADPYERFVDVNGNGVYDEGNETWDANTTIWAYTHVAMTGIPETRAVDMTWTPDDLGSVPVDGVLGFTVRAEDAFLNVPAPSATTYSADRAGGAGTVTLLSPEKIVDFPFASMDVRQVVLCEAAVCRTETRITTEREPQIHGQYVAPATVPPSFAIVRVGVTVDAGDETIATTSGRGVSIIGPPAP